MLGLYGGAHCRAIPVVRISNEGIKQYNSIIEAAQDNGVEPSNIVKCCKGKHNTCGGYLWAYSKMVADIKKQPIGVACNKI